MTRLSHQRQLNIGRWLTLGVMLTHLGEGFHSNHALLEAR